MGSGLEDWRIWNLDGDIDDLVNFSRYRGQRVTKMMTVMMMIAKPEDQE